MANMIERARQAENKKASDDQNFEAHLTLLTLTAEVMVAAIEKGGLVTITGYGKRNAGFSSFAKDVYAALADAHNPETEK